MNEDIFSKLLPEEHLEEYLKKSKRLDGREFDDHRAMIIEICIYPKKTYNQTIHR